ncbi:MAG: response regulator [Promethearchaeia archaeon]
MSNKILVVEDEEPVKLIIQLVLENNGYTVLTAKNGENALSILKESDITPELIISDIRMPEMDGYELFSRILSKKEWQNIPFIFLTGLDSKKDIYKGKSLGVDDYLTKPVREEDLLAIVRGKLKRRTLKDRYYAELENTDFAYSVKKIKKNGERNLILFLMKWDDEYGAILKYYYPELKEIKGNIENLGQTFMQVAMNLTNKHEKLNKPPISGGVIVNLKTINQKGYIYFDTLPNNEICMMSFIAPDLSYYECFKIKSIMQEFLINIKKQETIEIKKYWEKIIKSLMQNKE